MDPPGPHPQLDRPRPPSWAALGASSTDAISVVGPGGARPHRLSRARLAWVLATSRRRWAVSVWLCLIVALAVPALEPLLEVVAAQSAVAQVVRQHGSLMVEWSAADAGTFSAIQRRVETTVAARMGSQLTLLGASTRSGPFLGVTPEGRPARVLPGNQGLTPTYLDHLASHVSVVAGELPPDGLGGGDTAVTRTQAAADQLGLRVNDRFCMEATGTQPPSWCARLVGLWEPTDPRDPYWGSTPPQWQLAIGRYDFFRLMSQRPPHQAVASLRFWASSAEIDAGEATAVARQVQDLSGALRRSGLRVVTSLDRSLERFAASQRATNHASRLVAATVALLGLLVAALATVRLLGEQSRELGVLRARGWSRRGTWQLASAGPVTLVALALPVAVAASVAITAASAAPSGITLYAPHLRDLAGPAAAFMVNAVGLIVVIAWSAAWAGSWDDAEPSRQRPLRDRRTGPWETAVTVLFASAGCCAVALP